MQSPFIQGSKSSLKNWKELRNSLSGVMSDMEQMVAVVSYWSKAPIMACSLNWDGPNEWPDPWKLIFDGNFDESLISLGMFYTLLLSDDGRWGTDRLSLILILDRERQAQRLVLEVDSRWILNLDYNSIVDGNSSGKTFFIQQRYLYDGKEHSVDARYCVVNSIIKENL